MIEKKPKIKTGALTIYTKTLMKEYYVGRMEREQFTINITPEAAHKFIVDWLMYIDAPSQSHPKIAYLPNKSGELAIPFENIDTIDFRIN